MLSRNGVKWNRSETILALELYCITPFNKISNNNTEIIGLANLLGRTVGSVILKMFNLAHNDPELQKRNIKAMANGSKLDKEIWDEFWNNWEELAFQAETIKSDMRSTELSKFIESEAVLEYPEGLYMDNIVKTRIGQEFFRASVLSAYSNRCCITGIMMPELLIASHIKPWKVSDVKTERTNPKNGLCLNALHDKAFDRGLITLDKNYNIVLSHKAESMKMDTETKAWFMSYSDEKINLPEKFLPGKEFIEYHNDIVFLR